MNLKEISLFITEPIALIPEKAKAQETLEPEPTALIDEYSDESNDRRQLEDEEPDLDTATYEGNFQKGLLILYQGNELPEGSQVFLMSILKAVNHSLKDIALISEAALRNGHPESITHLNPRNILIFGKLNHPVMQIRKVDYAVIQQDCAYLFADDLRELETNKPLKIKLWSALQLLFNIKK
jgi:hypothetical protein